MKKFFLVLSAFFMPHLSQAALCDSVLGMLPNGMSGAHFCWAVKQGFTGGSCGLGYSYSSKVCQAVQLGMTQAKSCETLLLEGNKVFYSPVSVPSLQVRSNVSLFRYRLCLGVRGAQSHNFNAVENRISNSLKGWYPSRHATHIFRHLEGGALAGIDSTGEQRLINTSADDFLTAIMVGFVASASETKDMDQYHPRDPLIEAVAKGAASVPFAAAALKFSDGSHLSKNVLGIKPSLLESLQSAMRKQLDAASTTGAPPPQPSGRVTLEAPVFQAEIVAEDLTVKHGNVPVATALPVSELAESQTPSVESNAPPSLPAAGAANTPHDATPSRLLRIFTSVASLLTSDDESRGQTRPRESGDLDDNTLRMVVSQNSQDLYGRDTERFALLLGKLTYCGKCASKPYCYDSRNRYVAQNLETMNLADLYQILNGRNVNYCPITKRYDSVPHIQWVAEGKQKYFYLNYLDRDTLQKVKKRLEELLGSELTVGGL